MRQFFYILLLLLATTACHRVKPQSPANRQQDDSVRLATTIANVRLADAATAQCTAYAAKQAANFVLSDYGFWYQIRRHGGERMIEEGDHVEFCYESYTLEGTMIENVQTQVQVSRRETFFAVDVMLTELAEGDEITLIAPYYTAYGRDGDGKVPPLTNCLIILTNLHLINP